ncbi:Ceramide kinase, partial [Myotis brandtii]
VHCVKRARRHRWKCEQVTFCGADEQLCHLWLQTLREQLDKLTCRPKRLLVFINPFGGKGQGLRIYERKVAPLFALAAISTEVIVTERANHAKEALYEMSVDSYDGGRGGQAGGQWRAVHHHGALLRYSVSLLGYGFYGDIIKDSEKKRWMGLIRYDFSASGLLCSRCFVCRQSKQQLEEEQKRSLYGLEGSEEVEEWKVICGKFLAINAANMSCACPRSPRGLSPAAHLGDGSSDLILIRKCSRFNFLRFLVRHTNQGDQFDFTFVEVYRIKKFQFVSKQVEDEDSDLGERGKPGLRQICSQHPSCCCSAASSSPGVAHPVGAAVLTLGTRQVSITVTGL